MRKKSCTLLVIITCVFPFLTLLYNCSNAIGDFQSYSQSMTVGEITLNNGEIITLNSSVPGSSLSYRISLHIIPNGTAGQDVTELLDIYIIKEIAGYAQFDVNKDINDVSPEHVIFKATDLPLLYRDDYIAYDGIVPKLGQPYYCIIRNIITNPVFVKYYFGTYQHQEENLTIYFIGLIGLSIALGIALIVVIKRK